MPVSNVLQEIGSGRLKAVRITDPELMQTVGLMMSPHHTPSLATATVARVIHDLARELVNTAAWPEKYDKSLAGKSRAAAAKARSAR